MAGAPAPRRSDLDFADVFGGPPRRSSGNEHRSLRGSLDSSSFGSAPRARSGEAETPVFGDRGSSDRRRQLGEEFYKDIFPGSEAGSPRRGSGGGHWGDVFGGPASPGSTTRPRSSFSMINRGTNSSMPTSPSRQTSNRNDDGTSHAYSIPTSPNSQMNNYLAQGAPQQDSRKDPFSWHRYTFLSRFRSQSGEKKNTSNYVSSMDSECEGTPVTLENITANNNFHFSFYKWAGKGALLVLPATAQGNAGDIIGLRSFPQVVVQGFDLIDEEDSMSTATGASKSQTDYEDSKSGKHSTNSATKEGAIPLFFDDYMQGMKHSTDYTKNDVSSGSPSAKSSRPPSGEKSRGSRVRGKVKDFMKIFSPEGSPKRKRASETQDQTSIGKNGSKSELQDKFSISSLEANEDVKTAQMNNQNAFIAAPYLMSEVQESMDKPVMTANSKVETKMDTISGTNEAVSNESILGDTKDKVDNTIDHGERHVEDLDGCVVEHFSEDPELYNDQEKEQIKISESKIREWSRGKEGNIRSLLSTLQYVLWPESGWKPIPLVDIIEGAEVKKAYQKALLCLHPDKLQQRGAAMHQKYIAEKVFDILQESWKEFNTVTFG
ncbi:J domain-containing protein required for chloroplast accumulation response 1-like isoform X2 [Phragmites australis]|uniref:J domain-containing protein required for chloroplast accumulation response 1-like isoform X2 n=1 Tax=Phragmites australis TaxID=29695 RepID=UPI002D78D7F2|nr:J domain-containing protein required for chloroplast accumulation response 1-like isoform X2 [Phragmites australis]